MSEEKSKSGRLKPAQETLMSFTPQPGATPQSIEPTPDASADGIAMEEIATLSPQGLGPEGDAPASPPGAAAPGPSTASQAMRMPTRGASMSPQMPRRTPTGSTPARTPTGSVPARPASSPSMSPTVTKPKSGEYPVIPSAPGLAGQKIMVGTRLGQIEITGILGKGGMGQVFRGYHAALDIDVAIKVLPDELSRNEVVRQRFLREARLCVKLDHPNIVRVFNVDEWQGNLYLVMELIEGADAAGMLKDGGRFKFKRALEIGAAAAEALAYAHTQGLVHRDVKPHNILLGSDGKIKLSDFGLARAATSSSHLTMSGQIMGTPHYMSPEQAESKEVTDKSDVYSLGVTIYHMLTGETPFVGDTPISVAVQHIAKEIIFPEYRFAPFPKELVAVLKRMVAKDASKRCSAKQAAVWMNKLTTIIDGDDILTDEALNKTLAPVVAESEAFRVAAEKRRANDEAAREEAASMIMTMREAAAPVMPTVTEQAATASASAPSSSQVIIQREKGSGVMVAVVVLMALVIGGGGGAWYFLYGPGAKTTNEPSRDGVSRDGPGARDGKGDSGKPVVDGIKPGKDDAGKDGAKDGPRDGSKDAGKDGPSHVKGPEAFAAKLADFDRRFAAAATLDDLKAMQPLLDELDGLRKDATAEQRTEHETRLNAYKAKFAELDKPPDPPPATVDDPAFADKLNAVTAGFEGAQTLVELRALKALMDELEAMRASSSTSVTQREVHDRLKNEYRDRIARLEAEAWLTEIEGALTAFESIPNEMRLKDAVATAARVTAQSPSPAVENALKERREAALRRLEKNLQSYFEVLMSKANNLADNSKWKEADEQFTAIETFPFGKERQKQAGDRRTEVAFLALISTGRVHIKAKGFEQCDRLIREIDAGLYPLQMKSHLDDLKKELYDAMGVEMNADIKTAMELAAARKFKDAEKLIQETNRRLPLKTDQSTMLGKALTSIQLGEPLYEAEQALARGRFMDVLTRLNQADALIKKQVEEKKEGLLDKDQLTALATLKDEFTQKRDQRFDQLLSDAQLAVDEKDFNKAAALIADCDNLPKTEIQDGRLKNFKDDNQTALRNYLQKLLDEADSALSMDSFNQADSLLRSASTIPAPDDLKTRMDELRASLTSKLGAHYNSLHKDASADIEGERFDKARQTLDIMAALPVDSATASRTQALERRYLATLEAALDRQLKDIRKVLAEEKFGEADSRIELAARLPLTTDLEQKLAAVRIERDSKVESALKARLEASSKARTDKNFDRSDSELKAADLLPLSDAQKKRLADARTSHGRDRESHIEALFKKLADCVASGDEPGGQAVKADILKFTLTPAQRSRLDDLDERLTGTPRSEKVKSLPPKLAAFHDDPVIRTEQSFKVDDEITALFATNDGKFAAAATRKGDVYFYNLRRSTLLGKSSGGRRPIAGIAVSSDARWGVSCAEDGGLVVFDFSGGRVNPGDVAKPRETVIAVAFSADDRTIFGLSRDGTLYRISPQSRTIIGEHKTGVRGCMALAVDPKGQLIAAGGDGGRVAVLDATRFILKRPDPVRVHGDSRIHALCFSQDGKRLLAAGERDGVGVWDVDNLTERPRTQFKGLQTWARGCGFSDDGSRVCALDRERRMIAWSTANGAEQRKHEYESLKMDRVEFRPTAGFVGPGGTLLVGTREGLIVHFTVVNSR